MNKLTEEQAAWLIGKIKEINWPEFVIDGNELTHVVYRDEVIDILNQCTGKEFPFYVPNYAPVQITYAPENKSGFIALNIIDDGFVNGVKYLNKDEFLQFAEGCQKIKEWLENE